jgi:hypothetical protein
LAKIQKSVLGSDSRFRYLRLGQITSVEALFGKGNVSHVNHLESATNTASATNKAGPKSETGSIFLLRKLVR